MTERVDILRRIFKKIAKQVKNKVTGTEKRCFWLNYQKTFQKLTFFGPVTSTLTFLQFSIKKMRRTILTLPVISSFIKFCIAQTSRTRLFLQLLKS